MAGGGIGEAMLISAVTGAGTAAVTGGDPLKGALLGAATGGIGHGIAGATAAGGANVGTQVATTGAEQMVAKQQLTSKRLKAYCYARCKTLLLPTRFLGLLLLFI
jgi:hypothetical protein